MTTEGMTVFKKNSFVISNCYFWKILFYHPIFVIYIYIFVEYVIKVE